MIVKEVYKDAASPAVQEVWKVWWRAAKALLFPIRSLLWGWEQIEELVENWVNERLKSVPEEKQKSPDPEIAVPLLQALNYTAHNETLREMYMNLLVNSMNADKENIVHPSFVEIIKQMSSLDAKLFNKISVDTSFQPIINPRVWVINTNQFYPWITPIWYLWYTIDWFSEFDVSAALVRLDKFWLIDLMMDRTAWKDWYEDIESTPFLLWLLEKQKTLTSNIELKTTKSILKVNEYWEQFRKSCI